MMTEQRAMMPTAAIAAGRTAIAAGRNRSAATAAAQGAGHNRAAAETAAIAASVSAAETATPTAAVSAPAASATATAPARVAATAAKASAAGVGIMTMPTARPGLISVPDPGAAGRRIQLHFAVATTTVGRRRSIAAQAVHGAGGLSPQVPQAGKPPPGHLRPWLRRRQRPGRCSRARSKPHKPQGKSFACSSSPSPVFLSHAGAARYCGVAG